MRMVSDKFRVIAVTGTALIAGFIATAAAAYMAAEDAGAETAQRVFAVVAAAGLVVSMLITFFVLQVVNRYHARLQRMAGSDPLTGLLNRQAFEIVFTQALLEAERGEHALSFIHFDIDFFKQLNEIHGHAAGDEALRTVARIGKALLRESDVMTRWSGTEFFVLLKDCRLDRAVSVAEKLRQEIDRYEFSRVVPDWHITISLGVAQHIAHEPASAFLDRAEDALNKAKLNGRNRLQVALPRHGADNA